MKYITFVILLYLRVPLKWLLLFHLRIGGRKGRNLAWALYPYHTHIFNLSPGTETALSDLLFTKKKKKILKKFIAFHFKFVPNYDPRSRLWSMIIMLTAEVTQMLSVAIITQLYISNYSWVGEMAEIISFNPETFQRPFQPSASNSASRCTSASSALFYSCYCSYSVDWPQDAFKNITIATWRRWCKLLKWKSVT